MLAILELLKGRGISPHQAILEVLMKGENYGLGIRDEVKERTGVDLGPGTLYPALHALERDGLVKAREGEKTAERGGRAKVYYELTAEGARAAVGIRDQVASLYGWTPGVVHGR